MRILSVLVFTYLLLGAAVPAKAEPSHAFLLQGGRQKGGYLLGLQVKLTPGWMTYWRDPGEAGVAPTIDMAGSENLRSVSMEFPAPKDFDEHGLKVHGYESEVIFPLLAVPKNPRKPVRLRLKFSYAVCEKTCVLEGVEFNEILSSHAVAEGLLSINRARSHVPPGDDKLFIKTN